MAIFSGACLLRVSFGVHDFPMGTDSREEIIPETSVTSIRPILEVAQQSQERPELVARLSKQRAGSIELQERKHEELHTVWRISPGTVLLGWIEVCDPPPISQTPP